MWVLDLTKPRHHLYNLGASPASQTCATKSDVARENDTVGLDEVVAGNVKSITGAAEILITGVGTLLVMFFGRKTEFPPLHRGLVTLLVMIGIVTTWPTPITGCEVPASRSLVAVAFALLAVSFAFIHWRLESEHTFTQTVPGDGNQDLRTIIGGTVLTAEATERPEPRRIRERADAIVGREAMAASRGDKGT